MLTAEAIERWLGVGPQQALTCRMAWWRVARHPFARYWCLYLLVVVTPLLFTLSGQLLPMALLVVLWGYVFPRLLLLRGLIGRTRSLTADAAGLTAEGAGGRDRYAWSDVRGVFPGWRIDTVRGNVGLSEAASNAAVVVGAIRHILAARDAGVTLPSATPLPDTALSRLGGEQAGDDDRGLSISERDEG